MKKPAIIGGAIVVVLLLVGIFFLAGDSSDRKGVTKQEAFENIKNNKFELGQIDNDLLADLLTYRLTLGKAYRYNFERRLEAGLKGRSILNIELSGILSAHVIKQNPSATIMIVALQFQNLRGVDTSSFSKAGKGRSHTALLKIDRRGTVEALRFGPQADDVEMEILKDLIANWLQSFPSRKGMVKKKGGSLVGRLLGSGEKRGPFHVRGMDTQGEYQAKLIIGSDGSARIKLDHAKEGYIKSTSPVTIHSTKVDGAFQLQQGHLLARKGSEELEIGPDGFRVKSSQSFNFELKDIVAATFSLSDMPFYSLTARIFDPEIYRATAKDLAEVKVLPWNEVKKMLSDMDAETDERKRHKAFHQLTKTLKKDRAAERAALQEVKKYAPETDQFQMLIGALSFSGSKVAQAGLVNLFRNQGLNQRGLMNILAAFTMMETKLTPESREFLSASFTNPENPEIENAAGLAMGAGLKDNPDDKIRSLIEREWEKARTASRKRFVLDMIGNSGDDKFFPIILQAMRSNNSFLKAGAIQATRFMTSKRAERLILRELTGNSDERMAKAAAKALSYHDWKDQYAKPLAECVTRRKDSSVRIACANYALSNKGGHAGMKAVLQKVQNTGTDDFRAYVSQQLSASN